MFLSLVSLTLAAGARPITQPVDANAQAPRWSPDGTKLSYELNFHEAKRIETWIHSPGGSPTRVQPRASGASAVTAGFQTGGGGEVVHELSWGPPGYFVYSASGPDDNYELYLSSGSQLAANPAADGGPAWSPDEATIAFTSGRTGEGDVYLLRAEALDAPPKRVSADPDASELFLAWSPDSQALAWVGHTSQGDTILVVDDVGAPAPRVLAALGNTQTRPSFSPDGRHVAFYSNHKERGRFDLYVIPVAGGTARQLAQGVVMNFDGPQWSPDGEHLVYVSDDDEAFDPVFTVSAGGGGAKRVDTRTVGNGDHDLVRGTDGKLYLAIAAQGKVDDPVRDFKRIYVVELSL
jgi:Tol biopolymer transport system component